MEELLKYCTAINVRKYNANVPESEIIIEADFSIMAPDGVYSYAQIHSIGKTYESALKRAVHIVSGYAVTVRN